MGGSGSGSYQSDNAKQLVEDAISLSVSDFVKHGLKHDRPGSGTLTWSNGWHVIFRLVDNVLTLRYNRNERPIRIDIPVVTTIPYYGGLRVWFTCPDCRRRCAKVYIPYEQYRFTCRKCANLVHASTRYSTSKIKNALTRFDLRMRRVNALIAKERRAS